MKMKIAYDDFQIHTVPMEKMVFDETEKQYYILLDDINCIRWKVSFELFQAIKISVLETKKLNFFKGGDFPDDCFVSGSLHECFQSFIMEVLDSDWVKEYNFNSVSKDGISANKLKHFLIVAYDYIIEILAGNLILNKSD